MRSATLILVTAAWLALPAVSSSGERPRPSTLSPSNPCAFFSDRAYGRGLDHPATGMLWACEAIADRRRAGLALGDRLAATDFALGRYQAAVTADPGADDAALARSTGTLDALEAIAAGF